MKVHEEFVKMRNGGDDSAPGWKVVDLAFVQKPGKRKV